jgi:hypothetical protein
MTVIVEESGDELIVELNTELFDTALSGHSAPELKTVMPRSKNHCDYEVQ